MVDPESFVTFPTGRGPSEFLPPPAHTPNLYSPMLDSSPMAGGGGVGQLYCGALWGQERGIL